MIALAIVLCVSLLLLIVPKQSYPWAIAVAVPAYAWLCWIITRPLPVSDNWGSIDRFIISTALFLGMIPAFCRLLVAYRRSVDLPSDVDCAPTQASCLFVAIWGGAWFLTPTVPLFAGAATCLVIGLLLSLAMFGIPIRVARHRVLFISAGTALITGVIAILIWPLAVVAAAEKSAAGRPYCLVVAHGADYQTAANLLDLTPLIMRGREGNSLGLSYHGELLTSGEANRNWSYDHRDFFDETSDHEPPSCVATLGFARKLPWF